jgi:hypothetical protein
MKPCHHRIHNRCWVKYSDEREIQEQESLFGRQNKKYSMEDRARVLRAAEEGRDWQWVAESLDVKWTIAEAWIQYGKIEAKRG